MKLKLEFSSLFCKTSKFTINGIEADFNDFGEKFDYDRENAQEYGCGNMTFTRVEPTKKILNKYGINEEEYYEICDKLTEGLSLGRCGLCV